MTEVLLEDDTLQKDKTNSYYDTVIHWPMATVQSLVDVAIIDNKSEVY